MNEKSFAVEVSYLELMISGCADQELKTWLKSLLERFKEFASAAGGTK